MLLHRHVGANAVCQVCKDGGGDDRMLLCEACDVGYHFDCLSPPLEGAYHTSGCLPVIQYAHSPRVGSSAL